MTITTSDAFARLESAAHESAFGFGKQPPSAGQCEASNYKVGRINWAGLELSIEQPRYSVREKCSGAGKHWRNIMAAHYGYISGTKGADGDAIDCFIGPSVASQQVFVVNQAFNGRFDEHKVMLCFDDIESARAAYLGSYDRGWTGLQNIVPCSLTQLKWWLKYGDNTKPIQSDNLPHEGATMSRIHWTQDALPANATLDQIIYGLQRDDGSNPLMLDSVSIADILADPENTGVLLLDGLTTPYQRVERRMATVQRLMDRVTPELRVLQMQVSPPFKRQGTVNVAVVYELSDGQTISVYLHNPDTTPAKLAPLDELISWKWLLNKKDVTIVAAPERGVDLNINEVARRLMRIALKNSAAFQRTNARRAERMQAIDALGAEISILEKNLEQQQKDLAVVRLRAEEGQLQPSQQEPSAQEEKTPVALVDDAYKFAFATDAFKEYIAHSVADADYSAFKSAKEMDQMAISMGAQIHWDGPNAEFGVPKGERWLGVIKKDGRDIARADVASGDGKAMVYMGMSGDRRPTTASGGDYFYDEDLGAEMVKRAIEIDAQEQSAQHPESQEPDALIVAMVESARAADGMIAKIDTSDFTTFSYEGDEVVVDDELRTKVEAALGEPLVEVRLPGLEGQLSLVAQSAIKPQAPDPREVQRELNARAVQLSDALKEWGFEWLGNLRTNGKARVFYSAGDIDAQVNLGLEVTPFSRFVVRGPGSPEGERVEDDLSKSITLIFQELSRAIQKATGTQETAEPVQPQTFAQWLATITDGAESVEAMNAAAAEQGASIEWFVPGTAPVMDSATEPALDSAFSLAIASLSITASIAAGNLPIYVAQGNEAQAQLSAQVLQSAELAKSTLAALDSDSVALLASVKLDDAGTASDVCGYIKLDGALVGLVEIDSMGGVMVYRGNQVSTPLMAMRARREAAAWAVKMLLEEVKASLPVAQQEEQPQPEPQMHGPVFSEGDYLHAQFTHMSKLGTLAEYMQTGRVRVKTLVKVQKALKLTDEQFDEFANNLLESRSDLGKGGTATDSPLITQEDMARSMSELTPEQKAEWERTAYRLGTVVMAPNRATIVVDAQGYDYARYVGINPVPASAPNLEQPQQPEKTKLATKKEVRDVYDAISWAINDLTGHTPSEFLRASTHYLSEHMDEAKALLARGMPKDMKGVPDLEYIINKGQEMIDSVAKAAANHEAAIDLLVNIADGTTPAESADLEQMIAVGNSYKHDPDIQSLLSQAVAVIQAHELSATNNLH